MLISCSEQSVLGRVLAGGVHCEVRPGWDALYIKLRDARVVGSDEVSLGIIVDFDGKGEIVGIEVLRFSRRRLDLNRLVLEGPEALVTKI